MVSRTVSHSQARTQVNVLLNWPEELKRFVPAGTK